MYEKNNDEINLIEKAKAGNKKVFEKLVKKYQQRVFDLCYRTLLNRLDAEDATQETFLRVYKGIEKFKGKSKFYTYLYRIAITVCKDMIKKKGMQPKPFAKIEKEIARVDDNDKFSIEEIIRDLKAINGLTALEKKELKEIIWQCIVKLSPERRLLIDLIYYKGLTYKEVADMLDWPEGTVKSNIHRALKEIKECLKKTKLFKDW
ncbi:MAG: hypothetical protein DRP81_08485 [Candidatus Omnitrophota bacterium]|nr:MAG: hypothetical protein DRP81_08485 [Candidatus Omnitrophota bacterium]